MPTHFLNVTYRNARPFAAYLFLPRQPEDRSARTKRFSESLVIDYAPDDRPIGIEIVHPQAVTIDEINSALAHVNQSALTAEDVAPLTAA